MTERATRGPSARYYIDDATGLVTRRFSGATESCDLTAVPEAVWDRLAREGYIRLRTLDHSHADIIAGKAFPDRAPPKSSVSREPGIWIQAIAAAKVKDITAAKKAGGEKVTRADSDAIGEAALKWATGLTDGQAMALRKAKAVRAAYAELTGESGSLDELLAASATAPVVAEQADEQMLDAAE